MATVDYKLWQQWITKCGNSGLQSVAKWITKCGGITKWVSTYDITLLQKKSKMISQKTHLKVTDILDLILKRVPTVLFTFMETFISVFIYCFPVKQVRKLNA